MGIVSVSAVADNEQCAVENELATVERGTRSQNYLLFNKYIVAS